VAAAMGTSIVTRTHEALPATLTKRKLIWYQLKCGQRSSSRVWKTRTLYCMQPLLALFISSSHSSRTQPSVHPQEKSVSQSLKQTINSIQYIPVIHLNNWSSTRLFANCIGNEKFTKNNTFANDNTQQQYNIKRQYPTNAKRQNEFSNSHLQRSFPRTSHLAKSIISQDATHLSKPPTSILTPKFKAVQRYRSTAKNRPA
jgi:hypothetical protein